LPASDFDAFPPAQLPKSALEPCAVTSPEIRLDNLSTCLHGLKSTLLHSLDRTVLANRFPLAHAVSIQPSVPTTVTTRTATPPSPVAASAQHPTPSIHKNGRRTFLLPKMRSAKSDTPTLHQPPFVTPAAYAPTRKSYGGDLTADRMRALCRDSVGL